MKRKKKTEEHVMDSIVDHKINKSRRHRYAKHGERLYRVRWYDCGPDEDTWEPIRHLPRGKVLSYCKKKNVPIPEDIDKADDG